jgi:hypothetical protein
MAVRFKIDNEAMHEKTAPSTTDEAGRAEPPPVGRALPGTAGRRNEASESGAGAGGRPPSFGRRRLVSAGAALAAVAAGGLVWRKVVAFPPDTAPEGAYLRIAAMLGEGDPRGCFAYLEDAAQHAAYTIRDYRKKASERVAAAYPEPERARLLAEYKAFAAAEDGADVWVEMAARRGWTARLRRDLSGIAKIETSGDRATIETSGGTRYAFRRRENGIWGLSIFTADLVAEAERAARDLEVVDRAASDYERAR